MINKEEKLPEFLTNSLADKLLIKEIWSLKQYDYPSFEIRKNFNIIDIGAHVGAFTVYAAKKAIEGKIYSYEPHPENFRLLKKNLEINKIKNAKIFNLAVCEHAGESKLFLGSESFLHSSYIKTDKSIMVETTTLKEIFDKNKINFCHFLKIDAEGAEYDILTSLPLEYLDKIGMIVLEYHNFINKKNLKKIVKLLSEAGFIIKISAKSNTVNNYQGILYSKNSKVYCKNISRSKVLSKNKLEFYFSKIRLIFNKIKNNLDRKIGLVGLFLKKYWPKLYYKLKD